MSSDLCEELIVEIITRLPSKSLSKSLCSCISSLSFIHTHTIRSPQKILIRHFVRNKEKNGIENFYTLHSENELPLCPERGYIGITAVECPYNIYCRCVGSCNGIICMFDPEEYCISLWNPSIRHKLVVPGFRGLSFRVSSDLRYRFNPNEVGFGFDPITNDYKIVTLFGYVYSMNTGTWCAITSPTHLFHCVTSHGCFLNGVLHWVVKRCFAKSRDLDRFYILTFSLSNHVFGKIVMPEPSWESNQLMIIQGSLAVVSMANDDRWIWVMREYNNAASWSAVFKLKTNEVEGQLQRVLQRTSNGDLLFRTFKQGFQVYDPKIGAQSRLHNLDVDSDIFDLVNCVETLQLFDMGANIYS